MKKISIISMLLLSLSCSNKQDKIKESVIAYIKQNTGDPKTYEAIEWGKIDSLFTSINTDSTHLKYAEKIEHFEKKLNRTVKLIESYLSVSSDEINVDLKASIKDKHSADSLIILMDSVKIERNLILKKDSAFIYNFKPKFCGYSICHKFRAKNGFGALVLNEEVFTLDTNYLDIKVFSKDEWVKMSN